MLITQLIEAIKLGGALSEEASLVLGLLIEREKVHRPDPNDDGGIRTLLGDELADRRLSQTELKTAVDELINYISNTPEPDIGAIWALGKSYEARILPPLVNLLDKVVATPEKESLALQTLNAIMPLIDIDYALVLKSVHKAAEQGYGEVKQTAISRLSVLN